MKKEVTKKQYTHLGTIEVAEWLDLQIEMADDYNEEKHKGMDYYGVKDYIVQGGANSNEIEVYFYDHEERVWIDTEDPKNAIKYLTEYGEWLASKPE